VETSKLTPRDAARDFHCFWVTFWVTFGPELGYDVASVWRDFHVLDEEISNVDPSFSGGVLQKRKEGLQWHLNVQF
jgi:hypothetical protein